MTSDAPAQYVFATCKEGWEKQLKEAAGTHPCGLRPAFMRPGLVTWKCATPPPPGFELGSMFARVSGVSIGTFSSVAELREKLAPVRAGNGGFRLHVYPREVPENGLGMEEWARIDAVRASLLNTLRQTGEPVLEDECALPGDNVLDIILEGAGEDTERFFAGWHRHVMSSHPVPGGIPRALIPPEAPSRAWLKMVQALTFAGLEHQSRALQGRLALELGSAPGGASYALLQRGVHVWGVDPGVMDPRVLGFQGQGGAAFTHLRMPAGDLQRSMVPEQVDLMVSDLNLAPAIIIRLVEKFARRLQPSLLVLTLKINDRAVLAGLGENLGAIRRFAPSPVRVTQLPANRDEVCVVAGRLT